MSRPFLSSAARRLSQHRPARSTVSAISSPVPNPRLSSSASFCHSSYRTPTIPSTPKRNSQARCAEYGRPRSWFNAAQPCSAFSSSATMSAAQVTQNPRAGEDGNTLMVGISERAANVRSASPVVLMRYVFL
ncbi:hypothetical protein BDW62DRAFT_207081 [Aspergillus aurantiobrunneus]